MNHVLAFLAGLATGVSLGVVAALSVVFHWHETRGPAAELEVDPTTGWFYESGPGLFGGRWSRLLLDGEVVVADGPVAPR